MAQSMAPAGPGNIAPHGEPISNRIFAVRASPHGAPCSAVRFGTRALKLFVIDVTPLKAGEAAPIARGVAVRSEMLGRLPVHLFRRLEDGGKKRVDHPLEVLPSGRPNG